MVAAALTGCATGPAYVIPDAPDVAFEAAPTAEMSRQPFEARWWGQFEDPGLDDLVARALTGHLDLHIAAARVREARALLGASRRERWPSAGAAAAHDRRNAQLPPLSDERMRADAYEAGITTSWELDLFGRARRGVEAALADTHAAEAHLRAAQVLVASEVVLVYLELRGVQRRLRVAEAHLANQRETLELTRVRMELGRGNELDVASATARLWDTEAGIPPLRAAERVAAHRLAVLLGLPPGALDAELEYVETPARLTTLAVGNPEELLRRRPDIAAAERELAAATARVGIARADLFPRVSLSGFIGFIAGNASALGEAAARAWSTTPVLSWSAFDLGHVRSRLDAAEARAEAVLAAYEHTVLQALEEAGNAFVTYTQQRRRLEAVVEQVEASRRAAELARIQYREGALDFLRLLDAERTVLEADDAAAAAETDLNASIVLIYKALGGGWDTAAAG